MIWFDIFISFIDAVMCFYLCGAFLGSEERRSILMPSVVCVTFPTCYVLLSQLDINKPLLLVPLAAGMFLIMKKYYKRDDARTLLAVLAYSLILFVCAVISWTLELYSYGYTGSKSSKYLSPPEVIAVTVSRAMLVIICVTTAMIVRKRQRSVLLSFILAAALLGSAVMLLDRYKASGAADSVLPALLVIIVLLLIASAYIGLIYFFDSRQKQQKFIFAKQQNRMLEHSLREQERTFALWRKSVHDYKNTVLALNAMMKNGETRKLAEYLDAECRSFEDRAEYIHTGSMTVDTVVNTKAAIASERDIAFTVNAAVPEKCALSDIHFSVLLGNLIDNAIEASAFENDPFIHVQITAVHGLLMIKVINKCTEPPADISETSKPDRERHGIGLQSVNGIVREYDGEFDLSFENSKAVASVMIPL
ncbi:MAG: sensor histidine kinase [Ruminococcus sp.]|nr:sensor histidine kinase [Ruminococcus sp.]